MSQNKHHEIWVSTREFCKHAHIQPNTAHIHHMRVGHYYGCAPRKQQNGRLLWPLHDWLKIVGGSRG